MQETKAAEQKEVAHPEALISPELIEQNIAFAEIQLQEANRANNKARQTYDEARARVQELEFQIGNLKKALVIFKPEGKR